MAREQSDLAEFVGVEGVDWFAIRPCGLEYKIKFNEFIEGAFYVDGHGFNALP